MKAKDVMTTHVVTISTGASAAQAAELMLQSAGCQPSIEMGMSWGSWRKVIFFAGRSSVLSAGDPDGWSS